MKARSLILFAAALGSVLTAVMPAAAQSTVFTYQGQLQDGGGPANGTYNFTFSLYTNDTGGSSVAGPVATNGVGVTNGVFTVLIDFGAGPWNGQTNWLEIGVETNTANTFTTLAPRQLITPTPYAIFSTTASNVTGTLPVAQLTGTIPLAQLPRAVVTNNESGVNISGSFAGNGGGLTNVPAYWQTVSGTGQTAAANYAYLLTNNSLSTLTLPPSPNIGDIVTVSGSGASGWLVAPNAGQTISGGSVIPAGVTWTAQNSASAYWTAIASSADGTKLVAVSMSGGQIYTSGDSGMTWTLQNSAPRANWQSVASSADGTKLVAIINQGQIYTSGDSGVTWTAQNGAPTLNWISVASSADGTKLVALVLGGQIYTSGDSGVTWTLQNSAPRTSWISVASSADGTKLVAVTIGGQIYTSADSGVTWTAQSAPSETWQAVASSTDGTKLVAVTEGGPIYTSGDSGVTWTAQNSGSQSWCTFASSADGTKLVTAIYPGPIYTSDAANGFSGGPGTKAQFQYFGNGIWQPLSQSGSQIVGTIPASALPASVVTNTQTGVTLAGAFGGNGGGLTNVPAYWQTVSGTNQTAVANYAYLLTNNALSTLTLPSSPHGGDTVTVSGSGTSGWQVEAIGGQIIPGGTVIPTGAIWTARNGTATIEWNAIASSADGTKLAGAGFNFPIYTSSDSGVTWTAQSGSPSTEWIAIASSADGTRLVAGGYGTQIYTSSDSGVTWTAQNSGVLNWYSIASSADGAKLVAASLGDGIYTSSDSGVTWTLREGPPPNNANFWKGAASSADGTKLVVGAYSGQIFTSGDSGVTWTAQNSGVQDWYSVASSADGTKLVAVALNGPSSTSADSGVTWTAQNGAPSDNWLSAASSADGTKLVAGTFGDDIYTSSPASILGGAPGTAMQFQHVGNGVWQPLGQSASQIVGNIPASALPANVVTNTETGVTLSGTFLGDGSGLTGLNAANLTGTLPAATLPASVVTNNETGVTLSGTFSGNGGGLTNLNINGAIVSALTVTNLSISGTNEVAPLTVLPRLPASVVGSVSFGSGTMSAPAMAGGRYLYAVGGVANTLQVFDVSNPTIPAIVGSAATGSGPGPIAVAGRYAYVGIGGNGTLQVFDVGNPSLPVAVGSRLR